jgi:hypothetical protein
MPDAKPVLKAYHAQAYQEFDWEGLKKLLAP